MTLDAYHRERRADVEALNRAALGVGGPTRRPWTLARVAALMLCAAAFGLALALAT